MGIQVTGVRFVTEGLGSFLGGMAAATRSFNGFLSNLRGSASQLSGFGSATRTLALDLGYLARRVIALSLAYKALDVFKDAVRIGLEQVIVYDRLSHSLAALTAREMMQTGAFSNFTDALKAAQPFAEATLGWIEKLAIVTIFESEDIRNVQVFGQAVGLSAKDAQAMTLALSAWGTVTGQQPHTLTNIANALTDMFAKGRVQAEEMRQLARNGIPAWLYLSEALGVTTEELRQMVSDGLVPADFGIKTIVERLAKDFGPALNDFMFSLAGLTSSFHDLTKINLRTFFMSTLEGLKPLLERVVSIMMQPEFKAAVADLGRSFGEMALKAAEFVEWMIATGDPLGFIAVKIDEVIPGFFNLTKQLGHLKDTFFEIAKEAFNWGNDISGGLAEGLVAGASAVVSAMQSIADMILEKIRGIQSGIGSLFSPETKGATAAPTGGGGEAPAPETGAPPTVPGEAGSQLGIDPSIFETLGQALENMNKKAAETKAMWAEMKQNFQGTRDAIAEVVPGFEKITPIVAGLGGAFGTILASGIGVAAFNLLKLLSPIGLLTGGIALLYKAWQENWGGIQEVVAGVVSFIESIDWQGLLKKAEVATQGLRDSLTAIDFKGIFSSATNSIQVFMDTVSTSSSDAADTFGANSRSIEQAMDKGILTPGGKVRSFFNAELKPVFDNISQGSGPLLTAALNLIGSTIQNVVIPAGNLLVSVLRNLVLPIVQTLAQGFNTQLAPALTTIFNIISGTVLPIFREMFNFTSGSLVPLFGSILKLALAAVELQIKLLMAVVNTIIDSFKIWWNWVTQVTSAMDAQLLKVPILRDAAKLLGDAINIAVGFFNDLAAGVGGVSGAIDSLIGWINTAITKLKELAANVPKSFLPSSPPPFAKGITMVTEALMGMNTVMKASNGTMAVASQTIGSILTRVLNLQAAFNSAKWGQVLKGVPADKIGEIMKSLADLGEKIRKVVLDIHQTILKAGIDGFDGMISNLRKVRDLLEDAKKAWKEVAAAAADVDDANKAIEDAGKGIAEAFNNLKDAGPKFADAFNKAELARRALTAAQIGGNKDDIAKAQADYDKAVEERERAKKELDEAGAKYKSAQEALAAAEAEKAAAEKARADAAVRAQILEANARNVESRLEEARQQFLRDKVTDPENAIELFDLRSKHIRELGDLNAAIDTEQDAARKASLIREREFVFARQQLELQLFQSQAQERQLEFERQIQQLGVAWSEIFAKFPKLAAPPWLTNLIALFSQLSGIQLPDWLTPGSPTPLELGLRGIMDAAHQLSAVEIPRLSTQFRFMHQIASPSQIAGNSVAYHNTYSPQFNLGVQTNNSPAAVMQSYEIMRSMYGN